jgi:Flp pilus assembly protein TadG
MIRNVDGARASRSRPSAPLRRCGVDTNDSGAAAVEFALVVPILLVLVFGIINFGFIFTAQISLNTAARDAARQGVVPGGVGGSGPTCGTIANAARANAGTIGAPASLVAVTITGPTVNGTAVSCGIASGSSTVTGSGSLALCTGSDAVTSPQVVVTLTNHYSAPFPLVPPSSATQTGTGKFQCEYS